MTNPRDGLKKWREITLLAPQPWGEVLPHFLQEKGFSGIWFDQEGAPLHRLLLRTYINEQSWKPELQEELDACLSELSHIFQAGPGKTEIASRVIEEEDWAAQWLPFFKPLKIGPVWIRPSLKSVDLAEGEQEILLDPGQAFGTGHHETTQLCLEAILQARSFLDEGAAILDLGTGTGVLAMFAARLGFKNILALDNDPEAVKVALQNVEKNGLSPFIEVSEEPIQLMKFRFNLVLANLTASLHRDLAGEMVSLLKRGGRLVLSGILADDPESVYGVFTSKGLDCVQVCMKNEWACMIFQNGELDPKIRVDLDS